ncbi:MAG: JAB domain-containing protein [Bacteroidales bacterium]|jgi:hypothetical protein
MRKFHEIKTYLQEIEHVVNGLKTERDLTRELLFRAWFHNQSGLPIENNNIQVPNEVVFLTKQDEGGKTLLLVQNSIRSNYDKIINQLRDLGFSKSAKGNDQTIQLNSSRAVYKHIKPFLSDLPYECFYIILLDVSNRLIKTVCISEGGISGTLVDPKKVFKIVLDNYSTSLILSHNHPSGNLNPSKGDEKLTKKIIEGGKLLDINVIDHLIIGMDGYFSFADEGLME